jgi:hypothetical protein
MMNSVIHGIQMEISSSSLLSLHRAGILVMGNAAANKYLDGRKRNFAGAYTKVITSHKGRKAPAQLTSTWDNG